MAKIKGVVYLFVGILIGGVSLYLDYGSDDKKFQFFFYIGVLFILWGILKTIFQFLKSQTQGKVSKKHKIYHEQDNTNKKIDLKKPVHGNILKQETLRKFCHKCGKNVGPADNFCYHCGTRLK